MDTLVGTLILLVAIALGGATGYAMGTAWGGIGTLVTIPASLLIGFGGAWLIENLT